MSFHYIRKIQGNNLLRADGYCDAISVQQLLTSPPLPLSVSCAILHYVADILHDAQKNHFIHGDITSETVCVQPDGSVLINGYGRPRSMSFAPEETPDSSSDVYALGLLMLQMMTPAHEISLPFDKGLHNQAILEHFLQIDWENWSNEAWLPGLQEFLLPMLSFERAERPQPLDIANIIDNARKMAEGPDLETFIRQQDFDSTHSEQLSGPTAFNAGVLMQTIEVTTDSSQGIATGMWSKDKIMEMFKQEIGELNEEQATRQKWAPKTDAKSTNQALPAVGVNRPAIPVPIPSAQSPAPRRAAEPPPSLPPTEKYGSHPLSSKGNITSRPPSCQPRNLRSHLPLCQQPKTSEMTNSAGEFSQSSPLRFRSPPEPALPTEPAAVQESFEAHRIRPLLIL